MDQPVPGPIAQLLNPFFFPFLLSIPSLLHLSLYNRLPLPSYPLRPVPCYGAYPRGEKRLLMNLDLTSFAIFSLALFQPRYRHFVYLVFYLFSLFLKECFSPKCGRGCRLFSLLCSTRSLVYHTFFFSVPVPRFCEVSRSCSPVLLLLESYPGLVALLNTSPDSVVTVPSCHRSVSA